MWVSRHVYELVLGSRAFVVVYIRWSLYFYQRVSIASYASAGIAKGGMSVCPSVTLRYCIKMKKASVMISSPSESLNILVSRNIWFITKFDRGHPERERFLRLITSAVKLYRIVNGIVEVWYVACAEIRFAGSEAAGCLAVMKPCGRRRNCGLTADRNVHNSHAFDLHQESITPNVQSCEHWHLGKLQLTSISPHCVRAWVPYSKALDTNVLTLFINIGVLFFYVPVLTRRLADVAIDQ